MATITTTPLYLYGNTSNSTGTFNYWVNNTVAPQLQSTLNLDIYTSFQKSDQDKYPQILVRYYVEQHWSRRRAQYYDACQLHVINNKNDEYNSRRICNGIMSMIGISQEAMFQIMMLDMLAINQMTAADFANPSFTPTIQPYKIEVRTDGGWKIEEPDERIRHYVRDFVLYY